MPEPVGYGLPAWLDTDEYMTADEVRALGETEHMQPSRVCPVCCSMRATDRAHVVRKGMGGKPKGTTGPTVMVCRTCHEAVDRHEDASFAVKRDSRALVLLTSRGATVHFLCYI